MLQKIIYSYSKKTGSSCFSVPVKKWKGWGWQKKLGMISSREVINKERDAESLNPKASPCCVTCTRSLPKMRSWICRGIRSSGRKHRSGRRKGVGTWAAIQEDDVPPCLRQFKPSRPGASWRGRITPLNPPEYSRPLRRKYAIVIQYDMIRTE